LKKLCKLSGTMKVPTASLSSILSPEKLDNLKSSCANGPFLKAKLCKSDEGREQLCIPQTNNEETKVPKLNSTSLTRLEISAMQTTRGQSLPRPKFTISNAGRNVNSVSTSPKEVEDATNSLRRPVASLQKITSPSKKDDDSVFGFVSFSQSLNALSSCSPTSSDPVGEVADQPSTKHRRQTSLPVLRSPLQKGVLQPSVPLRRETSSPAFSSVPHRRKTSLPVLSTPLKKVKKFYRPKTTIKRLFTGSPTLSRRKLEIQKTDVAIKEDTLKEEEIKETSKHKLQSLEDSVEKLAAKLAAISLRADNLHRESTFYKTVIFRIENIIARSQDQSVFSSLRITNF